ncbi:MAG: glycosyltransferase [Conexibacter sp.]|nr:glycosyltransferase [Conexibacter sp.]
MAEPPAPRDPGAASLRGRIASLRESDLGKAAGLAVAMIVNNVIALGATVIFARQLDDYGSLAALVSYYLILSVAGQAMQVATARATVLGRLGSGPRLLATLRSWSATLLVLTLALAVVSILLRAPIANAVGVHEQWAAAVGLPAGVLWLLVSILRGALQGLGDYRSVGLSLVSEQGARLIAGVALAGVGLDVTGAFLGTPVSLLAVALYCGVHLRRRLAAVPAAGAAVIGRSAGADLPAAPAGSAPAESAMAASAATQTVRLRDHVAHAWAPIAGLIVIAILQNIDIIAAKHQFSKDVASSYGATAVAAKVLIWVAMGAGFYLVPETSRLHSEGKDTRAVLLRALAIVGVCAVPVLLIFILGGRLLLKLAFGADRLLAVGALVPLGVAFTLLAVTYLSIQYLLALGRTRFLLVLGAVAAAEPILLLTIAPSKPDGFAFVLLAIQAVAAALSFALAWRERPAPFLREPVLPFAAREQEPVAPAVD